MNYEIISEAPQTCLVKSCSECCMTEIDGKPNVRGMLHQAMYRKRWVWIAPIVQCIWRPRMLIGKGY